ncbi:MAG TPA: carotenoid oxygenase family protein [Mycobacteriales bacterium]|jgi:carotenoid cleavage dioxygenase|nr:carotenoid oxygenase family protein [Mycobacteriales bacterium]
MTSPYLEGNLAPIHTETTSFDLDVTGELPAHLDGRYLRIGPNPIHEPDDATYHWFLGDGMVHGLRLADGEAKWYRNRYVRSADVATALGEAPRRGPLHAGFDISPNTNVIGHAGRTFAIVEAGPRPYELTDELETVGPCDFDGTLRGGYTAHPHRDPVTGELHAVSYFWAWGNKVRYSVLGGDGRVRRSIDVKVHGSPMMHDFSLTENNVVLYDLPVSFDTKVGSAGVPAPIRLPARASMAAVVGRRAIPERLAARMMSTGGNPAYSAASFPYRWNPSYPARIGIFAREGDGSDIRWYDVDPCYVFHPLNAYEDGTDIVLDVVRHPKMFATDVNGPNEGVPTLDRWTVDTASGKVIETRVDDRGQEFPRIDERLTGRRHRYGYSVGVGEPHDEGRVIKHDLVAGTTSARDFGAGRHVSEFVFVPNDADAVEDGGVLMGFVYDRTSDRSDLVLLDAGTLDDVAAVHLPARVPQGFHGNWVPTT